MATMACSSSAAFKSLISWYEAISCSAESARSATPLLRKMRKNNPMHSSVMPTSKSASASPHNNVPKAVFAFRVIKPGKALFRAGISNSQPTSTAAPRAAPRNPASNAIRRRVMAGSGAAFMAFPCGDPRTRWQDPKHCEIIRRLHQCTLSMRSSHCSCSPASVPSCPSMARKRTCKPTFCIIRLNCQS